MGGGKRIVAGCVLAVLLGGRADAQWKDPKLALGQVGFNVAVSFVGKLVVGRMPPGRALTQALKEGTASGLVAHAGYSIAGHHPSWALAGKALAQKSVMMTRRSIRSEPVLDETLWTHWELTHSFVHFKWDGAPHAQIDVVNLAFSSYFAFAPGQYDFDAGKTLLSGALVFRRHDPPSHLRGLYVPGALWIDALDDDPSTVLSHEIIHSFQAERGSAIKEWNRGAFRFNWLVFASGVPALLSGWPEHGARWHEREADAYADPR